MKAMLLDKPGEPHTLRLGDIAIPVPGPGEVQVLVHACGLNPVDWKIAASSIDGWTFPHILGLDVSGVITKINGDCLDVDCEYYRV